MDARVQIIILSTEISKKKKKEKRNFESCFLFEKRKEML